ncbi:MAG: efflux RND transporter periplasmic adaptor subunit, partial [Acidobacteriota bacterium]|nr:efflux RND transporter periplasmic adaptor subunit [Acidobacteriota bacterium]
IYESDLPFVRPGQMAEIEFPYSTGGRKLRGHIDFLYPFLDPKTRTVQARIQFPNPGLTLRPETFTNVRLEISLGRQLLVPQDAVMDTGTEQYVFIDKGNGYVEPRRVKVTSESGDKAGILEGLKAGERVVTAANFLIDSDSRLKGAFANMGKPSPINYGQTQIPKQAIAVEVLEPKTAKTGMNTIRLLVKDAAGTPVIGAQVEVTCSCRRWAAWRRCRRRRR